MDVVSSPITSKVESPSKRSSRSSGAARGGCGSAEAAARAISELAERAQVLQRAAKGFPLPERDSPETAALLQHGARPGKAATTSDEPSSKAASLANLPREDDATPADAGS